MDAVGHDDVGVQSIVSEFLVTVANGIHDQPGDLRCPQVAGPCPRSVQEIVHGQEGPAFGGLVREYAICGKASVEPPGKEDGLANHVEVGETAGMDGRHTR